MRHKILVVDDEAHVVQVLSMKLQNAGYDTITAMDGEEALELSIDERPDLIITDFQMPYLTGLELCRALAANPVTAHIPIVILTAREFALEDEDLQAGNIRQIVTKPFSPRALLVEVAQLLGDVLDDDGMARGTAA